MIIKILGIFDILAAVSLFLLKWGLFVKFGWIILIILVLKSLPFIPDIASIVDLITAVFFVLAIYGYFFSFTFLFSVWLLQKGAFSVLS